VNGKRFDVTVWVPENAATPTAKSKPRRAAAGSGAAGGGSGDVTVPMQGTIVKVLVDVGQAVDVGEGIVVLEAMKMENQINAEKAGTVKAIKVAPGDTVGGGDVVAVIE
jgi:acetyl-CoA/propionyl-CoA carboxylase biotin carboxyl carrier protein